MCQSETTVYPDVDVMNVEEEQFAPVRSYLSINMEHLNQFMVQEACRRQNTLECRSDILKCHFVTGKAAIEQEPRSPLEGLE